jgi:hypothetical protein
MTRCETFLDETRDLDSFHRWISCHHAAFSFEQGTIRRHFYRVIVADDGIVMGSDSRSTFVDSGGKPVGYVDKMPKIYVKSGAAIAVAGLTSVEDELLSSFIRRNDYLLDSSCR